jgi:hypothetical protein
MRVDRIEDLPKSKRSGEHVASANAGCPGARHARRRYAPALRAGPAGHKFSAHSAPHDVAAAWHRRYKTTRGEGAFILVAIAPINSKYGAPHDSPNPS